MSPISPTVIRSRLALRVISPSPPEASTTAGVEAPCSAVICSIASRLEPSATSPSTRRLRVALATIRPAMLFSARASVSAPPSVAKPSSIEAGAKTSTSPIAPSTSSSSVSP